MEEMIEQPPPEKKWSQGQKLLLVCIVGVIDTGCAWFRHNQLWFVIDLIFWTIAFAVVASKKSN
jgi:hypothetical protein